MVSRSRLVLESLEAREVPASLSALLPDGSVVSGQFSAPAGVDPAQAAQSLPIDDLTVTKGGAEYTVQPGAVANYAAGVLVSVTAAAEGPDTLKLWADGTVEDQQQSASVAYDGADARQTFTLPDGTTGTVSYTVPWDQVDPTQARQSLTPAHVNLTIAGRNFAYSGAAAARFSTAPTLEFANGVQLGVSFALSLRGAGLPYSSISVSNGVATAIDAATRNLLNASAGVVNTVGLDFAEVTTGQKIFVSFRLKTDGKLETPFFTMAFGANATPEGIRDQIALQLERAGYPVTKSGTTGLIIEGKGNGKLTGVEILWGTGQQQNGNAIPDPKLTGPQLFTIGGDPVVFYNTQPLQLPEQKK